MVAAAMVAAGEAAAKEEVVEVVVGRAATGVPATVMARPEGLHHLRPWTQWAPVLAQPGRASGAAASPGVPAAPLGEAPPSFRLGCSCGERCGSDKVSRPRESCPNSDLGQRCVLDD